jgi:O-antigen ligase
MDQLLFGSKRLLAIGPVRVTSIFNEPSVLSYFLLDWLAIGLAQILVRRRMIQLLGLVPILVAFYFSGSAGGYVGLSVLAMLLLCEFPIIRRQLSLLVIIVIIPLLIWIFPSDYFKESISDRITQIASGVDPSMSMRLDSAQAAIKVWLKSPGVGVGMGNASFYAPEYYKAGWLLYTKEALFHITSDSGLLSILAENGIIGLVAFILMILAIIQQPGNVKFAKSPADKKVPPHGIDNVSSSSDIMIFVKILKIIVIVNFVELVFSGAFLFPRVWLDVGLLLSVKTAIGSRAAAVTR